MNINDRDLVAVFDGRSFRKASASGADGPMCVYLPARGPLNAIADSKTGALLAAPAAGLVAFAKTR